ncbi:helix-turn-helix domain-containing protein [Paenibacillus pinihumi]|uniref:helix-turn-helix domain-containing protein n=1 Tax=Paenibacillus pinihumi TaxID=669462 RepID=UPI00048ACE30|nr:helix-turn-helix transcriptional regulator [Paenibacillus pinihumi]
MLTFEPFRHWCFVNKKERKDVAAETGFSMPTIGNIYNDKFPFKTDTLETLCRVYGLRVEQVIEYKQD